MKTVMITGCNKGLGLQLLKRYVTQQCNIVALNRRQYDDFDEVCASLQAEHGISISRHYADFSDMESLERTLGEIVEEHSSIDVLVNNAGYTVGSKPMFYIESKVLDEVIKINLIAPYLITKHVSSAMMRQGNGSIINISSTVAIHPDAGDSVYGSTKAALNYITQSLASELAPFGIRINAVACGPFITNMFNSLEDKTRKKITKRIMLGRLATMDDICNMVMILSSEQSSFITGQIIPVDGGYR